MGQGLITSLLIKLTIEFWYFTIIALLVKLALIRFTVTNSMIKVLLLWGIGSVTFYTVACISGIVFSSAGFKTIPFIMYFVSVASELLFSSIFFRVSVRQIIPSITIGDGLFFLILFIQMV